MSELETLQAAVTAMTPASMGEWIGELKRPIFPNDCDRRLVAEYLIDKTGLPVSVVSNRVSVYAVGGVSLPDWTVRLIHAFDMGPGSQLRRISSSSTRSFFAEFLKSEGSK